MLVLKGGNALDFVWHPNRSTTDLDFSVDHQSPADAPTADVLEQFLNQAMVGASRRLGIELSVHKVRRNPPGEGRTFITYEARIGYYIHERGAPNRRAVSGRPSADIIRLDISINEPICADTLVTLAEDITIRVSTLEDVVAEKLRALLQQGPRRRSRPQDLLDIAELLRQGTVLDNTLIARFLLVKSAARSITASRIAFRDTTLIDSARVGYDALKQTARNGVIPFEHALRLLHGLVDELDIPEL